MALKRSLRSRLSAKGFSLLELSVVLGIIGLVMGGGMTLFLTYTSKAMEEDTRARMKVIENALLLYRRANERIPCPADITLATTSANFGIEGATKGTCTGGTPAANFGPASTYVVAGAVPTKTLRLPDDAAFDSWGRKIYYTVDKRFTAANGFVTNTITSAGNITVNLNISTAILASGNSATYIGSDTTTNGNWVGTYGTEGYNIINDSNSYPSYISVGVTSNSSHVWASSTSDARAPKKGSNNSDRIAACWYSASNFTVTLNNSDAYVHKVTLYAVDWDWTTRAQSISVLNASNDAVLDTRTISAPFNTAGVYQSWNISGNVKFLITNTASPNAILNAIFIDPSGASATSASAAYALISAGPNGHGAYTNSGGSTRINKGITNTAELQNCHCTSAGASGTFNSTFYNLPYSTSSADATNTYDDIVVFKDRRQILSFSE